MIVVRYMTFALPNAARRVRKRGDPSPLLEKNRFFVFFSESRTVERAKLHELMKLRENESTRRSVAKFDADALFTRPSPPHEARGAHNAARRLFSAALARDSSARGDARRTLPGRDPRERLSIPRNIQSRGRLHVA